MSDWSGIATAMEEAYSSEATLVYTGEHSAKITLRVPWADRYTTAIDIISNNRLWPDATIGAIGGRVTIKPVTNSKATSVTAGGIIVYEEALLTVSYDVAQFGSLEKDPGTGQIFSESLEPSIEYQKIPHAGFCWGGNKNGIELTETEAPVRAFRGMNLIRTLYQVAAVDSSILTLDGKTNSAAYTSVALGLTFPIETLLFDTPTLERTFDTSGTKGWNIKLKFAYKENGWNRFWNTKKSGGAGYDTIWDKVNNVQYKNFPPASFAAFLF